MTDEEHDAILAGLNRRTPLATRAYWLFRAAADEGRVCPPNRWLAEQLGYRGHDGNLSAVMRTLARHGLITFVSGKVYRQVTITQTGKSTKPIPDGMERRDRRPYTRCEGWAAEDPELMGDERPMIWIMRVQAVIAQKRAEGLPVW